MNSKKLISKIAHVIDLIIYLIINDLDFQNINVNKNHREVFIA